MTDPFSDGPERLAADALAVAGIEASVQQAAGQDPEGLVRAAAQAVAAAAPPGWRTLHAVFSLAGGQEIARAVAMTADGGVGVAVPLPAVEFVRVHRNATVGAAGPWLRLLFDLDNAGELRAAFDYGDVEIPADQLLPPDAYLRDFAQYPRSEVPLWLLAYIGNEGQQRRSAAQARHAADAANPGGAHVVDKLPPFDRVWARMAVLAAVCRGIGSPEGVRLDPAFALYRGAEGGCTVARLPRGRAVLSGGRNDSALLVAAYRGETGWPNLYRGAPAWVHDLFLDPRAANGLLSFCYWWDGHFWYGSDLDADEDAAMAGAVPALWSIETTATAVQGVLGVIGVQLSDRNAYAAVDFVRAADAGIVSERIVRRLFLDGVPASFDVDAALAQLDAAEVLLPEYPRMEEAAAKQLVVDYCQSRPPGTAGYPLDRLVAARMDAGWQVFAPVDPAEIAIGRTVFLVADDGVVDQDTTGTPPDEMALRFSVRFAGRIRGGSASANRR